MFGAKNYFEKFSDQTEILSIRIFSAKMQFHLPNFVTHDADVFPFIFTGLPKRKKN